MAQPQTRPLSQLNLDVIALVAERTILSPYFSFWIPVIMLCQGLPTSSSAFRSTCRWFCFTLVRALLYASHTIWRNRSWRGGWRELIGLRRTDWSEQVVLITGGADGLGRVLVETLAVKNITVVVLDVKEYSSGYEDVHFYYCDVSDHEAVREVAQKVRKEVGDPTVLINNAGVVSGQLLVDLDARNLQRTFGVNTLSHFYLLKEFLPAMIRAKTGHIVAVSSVLGTVGPPQVSDYSASKAALISLHESLRSELDYRHNCPDVRTTLVGSGTLSTQMFASIKPQNQFFYPLVSPHDLAKKILQALDCHESGEIWLPFYANYTWLLRGVPSWLRDFAYVITGSTHAMVDVKKQR